MVREKADGYSYAALMGNVLVLLFDIGFQELIRAGSDDRSSVQAGSSVQRQAAPCKLLPAVQFA